MLSYLSVTAFSLLKCFSRVYVLFQSGFSSHVNEFSVEPPGHSDDEYELMAQAHQSSELQTDPEAHQSPNDSNPHRPLSLDPNNRYTKSLSLPYITSPVLGPEESSSEEEEDPGGCSDDDYSSDGDEGMFVKSLPSDFFLSNLGGLELDTGSQEREEGEAETLVPEGSTAGDQEEDIKDEDRQTVKEEEEEGDQAEKQMQR